MLSRSLNPYLIRIKDIQESKGKKNQYIKLGKKFNPQGFDFIEFLTKYFVNMPECGEPPNGT